MRQIRTEVLPSRFRGRRAVVHGRQGGCSSGVPCRRSTEALLGSSEGRFRLNWARGEQNTRAHHTDRTGSVQSARCQRLLVARGLGQGDPMANAAIRSIAVQDNELDAASAYALGQGWLTNTSQGWSTLTPSWLRRCNSEIIAPGRGRQDSAQRGAHTRRKPSEAMVSARDRWKSRQLLTPQGEVICGIYTWRASSRGQSASPILKCRSAVLSAAFSSAAKTMPIRRAGRGLTRVISQQSCLRLCRSDVRFLSTTRPFLG